MSHLAGKFQHVDGLGRVFVERGYANGSYGILCPRLSYVGLEPVLDVRRKCVSSESSPFRVEEDELLGIFS